MKSYNQDIFEVIGDVLDQYREHEMWLPKTTAQRITTERRDGVPPEHHPTGGHLSVRPRFECETLAGWATVAEPNAYRQENDRLEKMTERVGTNSWEPTAVPVTPTAANGTSSTTCGLRRTG